MAGLPVNEENLKVLRFWWAPNLLACLRNHCFEQQKENQLFDRHREKQHAQTEIDRKSELVSEFNKNAKMVSKSSKHCKTLKQVPEAILMLTFRGRFNFFKDTFH